MMRVFMNIWKACLLIISLITSPTLAASSSLKRAVAQARKDIELYRAKASDSDLANFAEYLKYYRSEGHYQAVTPAPHALREALSPDAQNLFKKFIKQARPFTRKPKQLTGSSRLTQEGELFYKSIIAHVNEFIKIPKSLVRRAKVLA